MYLIVTHFLKNLLLTLRVIHPRCVYSITRSTKYSAQTTINQNISYLYPLQHGHHQNFPLGSRNQLHDGYILAKTGSWFWVINIIKIGRVSQTQLMNILFLRRVPKRKGNKLLLLLRHTM